MNALVAVPQGGWLVGGDFGGYDGFAQRYLVKILPESLKRPLEFQFALTNITLSETNSSVTLEVRRFGDANGDASVTVRTEDGSATDDQDYSPLDLTIHFAPGQWSQKVTLTIRNDQLVETAEQFSVVLTNATAGFIVGQPSTVRVQITSDDTGVEFIADSFPGVEEDGFVLAGVRWTGSVSSASSVLVNVVPETGSTNELVTTSIVVPYSRYPFPNGTNWFRIGIVDNAQHEATRRFLLELVPQANLIPGPRTNAALLIDDLDFAAAPSRGVAGVVEAIANSPDGGVYLGGDFTGVHGVPRNRVARLRPDGEVDTAFDPGRGPNGNVTALAVAGDGRLVIGGDFSEVNGVPRARVARLDANGALDLTFDPGAGPTRTNGAPFIRTLAAETNGSVLVGGAFTHFNGLPRRLLARLNPDGNLDQGFTSPILEYSQFPVPRGPDSSVIHSLVILPDGSRLAAGWMYYSAGVGPVSVVRLTPTGQIDPSFRKITWNSADQLAWSTAVAPNGTILVGGRGAKSFGTTINTNWIAIRRFMSNGVADTGFTVTNAPQINFLASEIRQLLIQPDGAIVFAAVIFSGRYGTEIHRAILGRLQTGGVWDADFGLIDIDLPLINVSGRFWWLNQPYIDEAPVPTAFAARQPDGVVVLAGAFDSVNGEPRRRLARLEPGGDLRGVLRLDIARGVTPALTVPEEVEIPYVVESSPDLHTWTPWRTNASPWQGWSEAIQIGNDHRFFRAVGP